MADPTPAGPVAIAVEALRSLVAAVPAFQTWTGSGSAAQALARVFTGEVGYPIVSVVIAGGVLRVETREPHNLTSGAAVELAGVSLGDQSSYPVDGPQTLSDVATHSLLIATNLPDADIEYPDGAFLVPCRRPLAVVSEADDALHAESIGTGGAAICAGTLEILLEADVTAAYGNDPAAALCEARSAFGSFIQGLAATQGTADYMCLNKIEPLSGPEFTLRSEQDAASVRFERWRALVRVTWGLEG